MKNNLIACLFSLGISLSAWGTTLTPGWYQLSHAKQIKALVKPMHDKDGRLVSVKIWTDKYIKHGSDSEHRHDQRRRFDCARNESVCRMAFPFKWGGSRIVVTGQSSYRSLSPLANGEMEENWMNYQLHKALSHREIDALVRNADDDGFNR